MTNFAVFANGTFWGEFEAETEEEAIQAAADEHGTVDVGETHASTEGMTAKSLGDYVIEIKGGCEINGNSFGDLVKEFFNCRDADVDGEGKIWIEGPQRGHWINAERTAELLGWIE